MSLRESNSKKAEHELKPDMFQSDADKLKDGAQDTADKLASYLPGQSKPRDALDSDAGDPTRTGGHDTGRADWGSTEDALKPSGEQTWGEKLGVEGNKLGSNVQPNESKSTMQNLKDAVTPGADSSLTPHNHTNAGAHAHAQAGEGQGVLGGIGQAMTDAKDAVVGALGGAKEGAKEGEGRNLRSGDS